VPGAQDPADHHRQLQRERLGRTLLVVLLAAYALVAATTTAFTGSANLVTALPIVVLAVLVVVRWPLRPHPLRAEPGAGHPWRAWVVLFGALVAWELYEYAARGSRADHPTFSSMLDAVDRTYVFKAVVFFLWLFLGAAIVRRGRPRPDGRRQASSGGETA
jgi:hypothetical protein